MPRPPERRWLGWIPARRWSNGPRSGFATADVQVASAEHLPFPDGHFTVVVNVASFHHWADRDAGLREILRVLAPGGRLLIMEGMVKPGKDGHGLNPVEVESLQARFLEIGYASATAERVKTGWRHQYYVVIGVAPETQGR